VSSSFGRSFGRSVGRRPRHECMHACIHSFRTVQYNTIRRFANLRTGRINTSIMLLYVHSLTGGRGYCLCTECPEKDLLSTLNKERERT
jgi:hypothetical protein